MGLGRHRAARHRHRLLARTAHPVLTHWITPTVGVSLVLIWVHRIARCAGPRPLATSQHAPWLLYAALAPFLLGLAFYAFLIAGFDFGELGVGT
jgi:hypothetical protein